MKKPFALILACLMTMLLIAGCTKKLEPLDITGTWITTNGEETISYCFSDSDSVSIDYPGGHMNCSYKIDENNNIIVYTHVPMSGENTLATFHLDTLDGGTKVLKSDDGLIFIKEKANK